ncbi:MAG: hypothetical protein ABI668_12565 [Sphingorhabdus sp.]
MTNLVAELRIAVIAALSLDPEGRAAFSKMDISDLLIIYWNWMSRVVPLRHYTVHQSCELRGNPIAGDSRYMPALQHIIDLLENGQEVSQHLSRGVTVAYQAKPEKIKSLAKYRDLDLLLNDWGVHHLHLSTELDSDGFVMRTKPLLFAVFKQDTAYLIDIFDHGDWASDAIPKIILRNWPDAGIIHDLGIPGSRESYSEIDKLGLRNAGMTTAYEGNEGKVYMFSAGLTTGGTSLHAAQAANQILDRIEWFEKQLVDDPPWLEVIMRERGIEPPETPQFKFAFLNSGYGVIEINSNLLIRLA